MTIRGLLLLSFLSFSALFAGLTTYVTYTHSRAALAGDIQLQLETQARVLNQQFTTALIERLVDIQGWRELEVMQDVRVGDIDKRLAKFLASVKANYGDSYLDIQCETGGRIIAAANASSIGQPAPPLTAGQSFAAPHAFELELAAPAPGPMRLTIRMPLPDPFNDGAPGALRALLNWRSFVQLLDEAAHGGRTALLLDRDGRVLAQASTSPLGGLPTRYPALSTDAINGVGVIRIADPTVSPTALLAGYATIAGDVNLPDLGWRIAVVIPETQALSPVRDLLRSLLAPFAALILLALLLAVWLSGRIAQPIRALAVFARALGQDLETPRVAPSGTREVGELRTALQRMIDDLKRSRMELVRAGKLAVVGELAAKLAHEVRTPLGIMRSSAQLVARQPGLSETGHEMLGYLINECDRLNQLVTALLDGARPREPVPRLVDLHAIVRDVAAMLRDKLETKRLTLDFEGTDIDSQLECDRDQLLQVLLNLLQNAIQATPYEGTIVITIVGTPETLSVIVDDSGEGIPAARREAILEPFVSDRVGGIGLGLSIVREIVTLHRGRLGIDTSPRGGARIVVTLPRRFSGVQ